MLERACREQRDRLAGRRVAPEQRDGAAYASAAATMPASALCKTRSSAAVRPAVARRRVVPCAAARVMAAPSGGDQTPS